MKIGKMIFAAVFAVAVMGGHQLNAQMVDGGLSHYGKGVELFDKKMYRSAGAEFAKAKERLAEDENAYRLATEYYIAVCAAKDMRPGAQDLLEVFMTEHPRSIYGNDVQFELGVLLSRGGDNEAAYERLSAVDPSKLGSRRIDEYNYRTGYAAYECGEGQEAYSYLSKCKNDPDFQPHATYYMAYIDYKNGNLTEAKRGFNSLADDANYETIIPFYLLQIEFKEGNYAYVIEHAPALLDVATDNRSKEILRILSESYFHQKDFANALNSINEYESMGGEMGPEELYLAGFCNRTQHYYTKAIEQLSKVAVEAGELGQNASFHLADCYLQMGDKKRALQAFAIAASADDNSPIREEAMFNQAKLQYELGGGVFNEAITVLSNYIKQYPNSANINQARELLLAAYFNTRNYEAAYDAIKDVRNPDNNVKTALQKISYFRGLQCFEAGNYDQALTFFNEADANRYNAKYSALTKFWRAETLMRQKKYSQAAPLYREYVTLSPRTEYENKIANYNLGYCNFNLKRWDEAASWFGKFTAAYDNRDNMLADAYNRLGDVSFANREYWKAIESYDKAIAMGSSSADYARLQRAVMLGLVDRRDRKIESLQEIINSNKGEYVDDAMYQLGRTYVQAEKFNEGATVLRDLVSRFPQSPFYLSSLSELGLIYHNLGKTDEALRYYKQVVSQFPSSQQARDAMLGIENIYVDNNNVDEYFAFAQSSGIETNVTIVERDSLSYESARRVYEAGNHARALTLMDNYLRQYPKGVYRAAALYALGDCSLVEGNRSTAITAFEEVGNMPSNSYKNTALQKVAKMHVDDKNYAKAAAAYKTLSTTATQTPVITEALGGYLRNAVLSEDKQAAIIAADDVLASPFVTPQLTLEATFIKAREAHELGNTNEAMAMYRKVATASSREGAESRYRIISILFDQGKFKEAEDEVFAFSEQNTPHQYWMAKSFMVLGDIYVRNNDAFQAKATYQSIVDGYNDKNDGIVDEARRKMETLK